MSKVLMPKATAVWLIDNTGLTFEQIADFCELHILEVKGIADGDVASGIRGADPIANGQLSREEIAKAEGDSSYRMEVEDSGIEVAAPKKRGPRYTPLSRRQDRPAAIAWMVRNHPELADSQIAKLIGTTKPTIQAIRERTHWNSANIQPQDPVTLGLCKQMDLDAAVRKAAAKLKKQQAAEGRTDEGETLKPVEKPEPVAEKPSVEIPDEDSSIKDFANAAEALFGGKDDDN